MAEKANTQACAQVRSFDQAGKIGDHKRAAQLGAVSASATVSVNNTQIRFQRGKGIVRNFRARRGDYGNQSGLAGIGKSDQADIGQEFQLQTDMVLFAWKTIFMFARSLMPGLGKVLVAPPTATSVCDQHTLACGGEIGDGRALLVERQRADGNLQDHVLTGMPGAVRAFAVAAAIGLEFAIVAVTKQGVVVGIGFEIDAAAMAAVPAGGAAARYVFFAPKGDAAVAAVAGLHQYFGFINEHRNKTP